MRAEVLVTLLLSAFINQCAGDFSCNKIISYTLEGCDCFLGTTTVLQCPQVSVEVDLGKSMKLQCNHMNNFTDFSGLSGSVGDVDDLILRFCPLLDTSIKDLMNSFGISKIKNLSIRSGNSFSNNLQKKNLKELYEVTNLQLNYMGLTVLPSDVFEDMGNLTFLEMRNNNISLPKGIFYHTPKLDVLELGGNNMVHLEPGVFKNLDHLRLLNLWGNRFVDLMRAVFSDVPNLVSLDLSTNYMETIRPDIFADLNKLQILNLHANAFHSLPQGLLSRNLELKEFKMHGNIRQLTTLPSGFLANLTNLTLVELNGCKLISLPEDMFTGSISINKLHLQENAFASLPEKLFWDLENLEVLDLSRNHITKLPSELFSRTKKLKKLLLNHNKLSEIHKDLFSNLQELEYLDLKHNHLKEIKDTQFSKLVSLKTVNLSDNQLSVLASKIQLSDFGTQSVLKDCRELVDIQLANNSLTEFFGDFRTLLNKLQIVNLSHNNIENISLNDLDALSNSVVINLSSNKIKFVNFREAKVIVVSHFKNINHPDEKPAHIKTKTVKLDDNPFICDCRLLPLVQLIQGDEFILDDLSTQKVQYLYNIPETNLNCNGPKGFEKISLKDVPAKSLTCPFQSITTNYTCPEGCECNLQALGKGNVITCVNLELQHLPLITKYPLTSYTELNLKDNKLVKFKAPEGDAYSNVTRLILANNGLTHFSIDGLSKKIQVLDLSNNELKTLAPDVISFLNTTELDNGGLALHGNPWVCDCDIIPLVRLLKFRYMKVKNSKAITCSDSKTILVDVDENSLCPGEARLYMIICIVCAVFGVSLALLIGLYCRYRTEIHIYCYSSKWKILRWLVSHPDLDEEKKYDAFISYSNEDEQFVNEHLVPHLEEHGDTKYKLCLHYRDWIGGESIPNQILHSVQNSRRTIVVLSPSFLESVWGKVEFRTAHSEALKDGTARVIIILYQDVGPIDDLDDEMKAYLRMNTYIKWDSQYFWQQLHYSLPHPPEEADDIQCVLGCFPRIRISSSSHEVLQNVQLRNGQVHYNVPEEPEKKNSKDPVNSITKSQPLIIETLDTKPAQFHSEHHQNGTALVV